MKKFGEFMAESAKSLKGERVKVEKPLTSARELSGHESDARAYRRAGGDQRREFNINGHTVHLDVIGGVTRGGTDTARYKINGKRAKREHVDALFHTK